MENRLNITTALNFRHEFEETLILAGNFSSLAVARYFEVPVCVIRRDLLRAGYSKDILPKLESSRPVSAKTLRYQRLEIAGADALHNLSVLSSIGMWHEPFLEKEEESFKSSHVLSGSFAVEYLYSVLGASVSDVSAMLSVTESDCYSSLRRHRIPKYLDRYFDYFKDTLELIIKEIESSGNPYKSRREASRLTGFSEEWFKQTHIDKPYSYSGNRVANALYLKDSGLTVREIAGILGCSVGTACELLHTDMKG